MLVEAEQKYLKVPSEDQVPCKNQVPSDLQVPSEDEVPSKYQVSSDLQVLSDVQVPSISKNGKLKPGNTVGAEHQYFHMMSSCCII
jgi:hypothetical protein